MAINDIEILCTCYEFDHVSTYSERSIMNSGISKIQIGERINLAQYATDIGNLIKQKTGSSLQDGFNTVYYDVNNISLKLSGLKNNKFLMNYFGLFDRTNILQFRRFYIDLKYNGTNYMSGYINPDNIKEIFNNTGQTEIITVQILDMMKEFKQYFSGKDLTSPYHSTQGFGNNGLVEVTVLPWAGDPRSEDSNGTAENTLCTAKTFFSVLFPMNINTQVIGPGPGNQAWNDWYVNNIPQMFYQSGVTNNWFLRSGYKRFWQQGFSVFDFLECVCYAMGWTWFITQRPYTNLYELYLNIINRSEAENTTTSIPFGNVEDDWEIGYKLNTSDFEYLIIPDGNITSNGYYHTQGNCFKMVTLKHSPVINQSHFFERIGGSPNGYILYPYTSFSTRYAIENARAQEAFDWAEIEYNGNPNWNNNRDTHRKFIKSKKIIYLDGGEHTTMKTVVNTNSGRNYPATSMGESDRDIIFNGNCGSMLFKFGGNNATIGLDYNSYTQSETFRNNYLPFVNASNGQTVDVNIKGLYPNIHSKYNFTGSGMDFFDNSFFTVKSIELDFIKETTKMSLVKTSE